MWIEEPYNKYGGYTLIYYLDEKFVIEIARENGMKRWCGMVRCPNYKTLISMYDKDIDVLKLNCLVKAKSFGWNIKDITI